MNKWTLLASVVCLSALTGSYVMISRRGQESVTQERETQPVDIDVEEFEPEEDGEDANTFNLTDADSESEGTPTPLRKELKAKSSKGSEIETIDEEDDPGETIESKTVVDDPEGDTFEVETPAKREVTPAETEPTEKSVKE